MKTGTTTKPSTTGQMIGDAELPIPSANLTTHPTFWGPGTLCHSICSLSFWLFWGRFWSFLFQCFISDLRFATLVTDTTEYLGVYLSLLFGLDHAKRLCCAVLLSFYECWHDIQCLTYLSFVPNDLR